MLETICLNLEKLKMYIAYENILNMGKEGLMNCVKILNYPDLLYLEYVYP